MKTSFEQILDEKDSSTRYAQLAGFWMAHAQMMQEEYEILKKKIQSNEVIERFHFIGLDVRSDSIQEATAAYNEYKKESV